MRLVGGPFSRWSVRIAVAAAAVFVVATSSVLAWMRLNPSPRIIVGKVPLDRPVLLVVDDFPPHREPPPPPEDPPEEPQGGTPRFSRPATRGLWPPNGKPPGPARPFTDPVDGSGGLQFVLVLGSDARSGNPERARADSIHVLALDPKKRRGTIVGIPRDSWVDVPGRGKRKINDALASGGPDLAVRTVRDLTGLPIEYYALTAFEGFRAMVDEAGGIDVFVPYDMNDDFSGAYFQRGWHHMNGERALAFSRNRHVPAGDFARSENQGRLMLDVLKKVRAETGNRREVEALVRILARHTRVNMSFDDLLRLAVLARVTAASDVRNLVAPGRTGSAGGGSVVFLGDEARALFRDLADDAVVNGSFPAYGPPPEDPPADPAPAPSEPSTEPSPSPPPLILPLPSILP